MSDDYQHHLGWEEDRLLPAMEQGAPTLLHQVSRGVAEDALVENIQPGRNG